MLILARKKGETIHINDDIVITVMDSNSNVVRLGIKAPDAATVKRGEVYQGVKAGKGGGKEADGGE